MPGIMRVYVDESGDRGVKPRSSPFFTFAAVCVRDANNHLVRSYMPSLLKRLNRNVGTKAKWTGLDHLERVLAMQTLAALPVRLIYVTVPKVNVRSGSAVGGQSAVFYNYAARMVVERASWLAADHGLEAKFCFEKVKGYPTTVLTNYIDLLRHQRVSTINWHNVNKTVLVDSPANIEELRTADLAAGAFDTATRPDGSTGLVEPMYLLHLAHRIWHRRQQSKLGCGFKVLGPMQPITALPWWPNPAIS